MEFDRDSLIAPSQQAVNERVIAESRFRSSPFWERGLACSHQLSTGRPIFPLGIRNSNIPLVSLSTRLESDVSVCPGTQKLSRIFLPFSSLSHVRATERYAVLLAEYTSKPGDLSPKH